MGVVHRTSAEVKKGPLGRMVWQQEEKPRSGFEVYKKFLDRDDVDVMTCGSPPKSFRLIRKPSRARTSPCGDALRTTRRSTGGAARGGGTPCATSRAWWSSAGWQRTFLHSNATWARSAEARTRTAPHVPRRLQSRPLSCARGALPPRARLGGMQLGTRSRPVGHQQAPCRAAGPDAMHLRWPRALASPKLHRPSGAADLSASLDASCRSRAPGHWAHAHCSAHAPIEPSPPKSSAATLGMSPVFCCLPRTKRRLPRTNLLSWRARRSRAATSQSRVTYGSAFASPRAASAASAECSISVRRQKALTKREYMT
jgi:hypothetical protein